MRTLVWGLCLSVLYEAGTTRQHTKLSTQCTKENSSPDLAQNSLNLPTSTLTISLNITLYFVYLNWKKSLKFVPQKNYNLTTSAFVCFFFFLARPWFAFNLQFLSKGTSSEECSLSYVMYTGHHTNSNRIATAFTGMFLFQFLDLFRFNISRTNPYVTLSEMLRICLLKWDSFKNHSLWSHMRSYDLLKLSSDVFG